MNEKAIAIGIALTVLAGAFLTCTAMPPADAATTEREWWPLNTNITVDKSVSGSGTTKYIQVDEGEILTVNWLAVNMTSQGWVYVTFYPSIPPMNWTNMTEGGTAPYYTSYQAIWTYHLTPPQTSWIRSGGLDVMKVNVYAAEGSGAWTPITLNLTVTRDNFTAPGVDGLEDKISALQEQLDALDIDGLRASIHDLQLAQASMNTEIASLRGLIGSLQALVNQQWASGAENDSAIWDELASLNASLSEYLKALEDASAGNSANLTLLTEKINSLPTNGTNTTTIINNTEVIENGYNDTPVWDELARLKAAPPIVQYNNTTQVHPTTLVYQNRTTTQKNEGDTTQAIVAGVMAGVLTALIACVIIYAQVRRRYGGVVKAPEQ